MTTEIVYSETHVVQYPCPHCGAARKKVNEYIPSTCGRSECQQRGVCLNFHEHVRRSKRSCPALTGCAVLVGTR